MKPIDAMIGGAQKAGTSSLLAYLGQHPQLCIHGRREFSYFVNDEDYARGYDAVAAEQFDAREDQKLVAKNVGVLYLPEALQRLHEHNPRVQLIFLLRNPIDRAYSGYWYARRMGWEDQPGFEDALAAGEDRFGGDWVRQRNTAYVDRGLYAEHLRRVYEHFDQSQVMVLLLEDMAADAGAVCRGIFERLGVPTDAAIDYTHRRNVSAAARSESVTRALSSQNPLRWLARALMPAGVRRGLKVRMREMNETTFEPEPMNPQTRQKLADVFAAPNAELGELIARDVSHWSRP